MLQELKVSNFAIIDNIGMAFGPGFNVLSGETGAGKSVLLKSLSLLMGGKAASDLVRSGAEQAVVEGAFDISERPDIRERMNELGIEVADETLIVRRVILKEGKSRVYINGSLSPLNSLQDLVAPLIEVTGHSVPLIEMTGQHENRNLVSKAYHLNVLDRFADVLILRKEYSTAWNRLQSVRNEIEEIERDERTRAQRLDFLTYQRDEIKAFDPKPDEETQIENEYLRLRNSSHLQTWSAEAENALYGDDESALVRIHKVLQKAAEFAVFDSKIAVMVEPLRQAKALIEDAVYEVRSYGEDLEAQPERLEELEKRRSDLRGLQKKYGATVADILEAFDKIEKEIRQLDGSEENLGKLRGEELGLVARLKEMAAQLHQKRVKAAAKLAKAVNAELEELNMKGVLFSVKCESLVELGATGTTDVEFMTQSSSKDEPRALGKAASGGELSRILLVLKDVVGQSELPRTYLFDEVDTGVSGPTAEKVGKKLKSIAREQQVICVTHLPQVAACGDMHFVIQKHADGKSVRTEVKKLDHGHRVKEIARLISGEKITKTSLAHAEQLLN